MANTYNFLKTVFQELKQENSQNPLVITAILLLVCIPLSYAANSIALGVFVFAVLYTFKKQNARLDFNMILPVLLYLLMALSVLWSIDLGETIPSLSKELALVLIPLCFMLFPSFTVGQKQKIIRYFSIGMTFFSIFYLVKAVIRFAMTKDISVFFYHELVTKDVNAIHVSVFLSVAFFYFFTKIVKSFFEKFSAAILFFTIFLLSSKNIIGVLILLIVCYYLFYSKVSRKTKFISLTVVLLLTMSMLFMPEIKERFKVETNTVMSDHTVNTDLQGEVYNVSISQAWNQERFSPQDYFPGTAFRVYQFRIFLEMMQEDNAWLTGYGLNASYAKIERKTLNYNLFAGNDTIPGYQKKNFHNQYVQIFAELGIFGFVLLLVMLFVNLKNALKAKDFVHISFAILMISLFLTESFLWRQRGVTFFTMMYCLFNTGMAMEKNKNL